MAASSGVHAVSFGKVSPSATLGQPLNVLVPIRLDQGERLFAECVQAEVVQGSVPLLPSQVRVSVQPTADPAEWSARVSTLGPIEEPVVEVSVSAGCERRFLRRFIALADPPLAAAAPTEALPPGGSPVITLASASEAPMPPAARRPPAVDAGPAERARPGGLRRQTAASATASHPSQVQAVVKPKSRPAAARPAATPPGESAARLLLDVGSGPLLKMDIEEPIFMPAGAAASAVSAEGDTELAQLQTLQKSLRDLRSESQSRQADELSLRARLGEAESKGRMVPWLMGLLGMAAGVAVWLALRLRSVAARAERPAEDAWWSPQPGQAHGPVPEPAPSDPGELVDLPLPLRSRDPAPAGAGAGAEQMLAEMAPSPEPTLAGLAREDAFRTQPLPAGGGLVGLASIADGAPPAREVSVEELLDLEQQADFFIALGQEDAAIDLLMSHLRSTGGLSPLPYTKLLEIYRRQGDRSAYERIRARFNRRFNVYAPDWEVGPSHGRTLEDYPDVIAQLQALWPSHLNAMAVLEAMLFRNDERQDLFDLPAYKDVLLLYSLARDLYRQEGVSAADVDLLLPLGDHGEHLSEPLPVAQHAPSYEVTAFSLELPAKGPDTPGRQP